MSRYKADLTAESLKLPESLFIADLLLNDSPANCSITGSGNVASGMP
jgi:hypothetical protein